MRKKEIRDWIYGHTHRNWRDKKKYTGDGEMKNDRHKNIHGGQEEISAGEKNGRTVQAKKRQRRNEE